MKNIQTFEQFNQMNEGTLANITAGLVLSLSTLLPIVGNATLISPMNQAKRQSIERTTEMDKERELKSIRSELDSVKVALAELKTSPKINGHENIDSLMNNLDLIRVEKGGKPSFDKIFLDVKEILAKNSQLGGGKFYEPAFMDNDELSYLNKVIKDLETGNYDKEDLAGYYEYLSDKLNKAKSELNPSTGDHIRNVVSIILFSAMALCILYLLLAAVVSLVAPDKINWN